MNNPVRFAYVGCGFVGQRIHIPNFASLPDCRFIAVAEARPELGEKVAARYGIEKVYSSHEEIANDPEIEAVGVSAPYALQGGIAEDLLRAGKHVFMEKPMAVSLKRAQSLVDAEAKSGARLMVGYMKRYDSGNVLLKKHLDAWKKNGEVGNFVLARNHGFGGNWLFGQDPNVPFETSSAAAPPAPDECPDWLPEKHKNSYLGYLQQWTHNINLLRFFLEEPSESLQVSVSHVDLNADGMTGLVILNINKQRAVLESAYTKFHGWEEHTQIYFEGGWLRTQAPPLMLKEMPATVEIYRAGDGNRAPQLVQEFAPAAWSYREEAKHFLHHVRSGEAFHSGAKDTLTDVRLIEALYRQFLTQK